MPRLNEDGICLDLLISSTTIAFVLLTEGNPGSYDASYFYASAESS
jgi:hypothetical protein